MLQALVISALLAASPEEVELVLFTQPTDLEGWSEAIRAQLSDLDARVEERPAPDLSGEPAEQQARVRELLRGSPARLAVWASVTSSNTILITVADLTAERALTREVPSDSASLEAVGQIVRGSVATLLNPPVEPHRTSAWHVGAGWATGPWIATAPWAQGGQLEAGWTSSGWLGGRAAVRVEAPVRVPDKALAAQLQRFELQVAPTATWQLGAQLAVTLELGASLRVVRAQGLPAAGAAEAYPARWTVGLAAFANARPRMRLTGPLSLFLDLGLQVALLNQAFQLDTDAGPRRLAMGSWFEPRLGAGLLLRLPP